MYLRLNNFEHIHLENQPAYIQGLMILYFLAKSGCIKIDFHNPTAVEAFMALARFFRKRDADFVKEGSGSFYPCVIMPLILKQIMDNSIK